MNLFLLFKDNKRIRHCLIFKLQIDIVLKSADIYVSAFLGN